MAEKIKVLHYLSSLGLGGTEKTCQLFVEHSSPQFESHVAFLKDGRHPRQQQFHIACKASGGNLIALNDKRGLQQVIQQFGIDILHVYRSGFSEFPEPGQNIRVPHFVETNVFGFLNSNPNIDKTLFMSEWLMNYSLTQAGDLGLREGRFDFVNNPVESPASSEKIDFKFDKDEIVLGRCGRPDPGIYNSVHVKAARLLLDRGYKVRFLAVAPPQNMVDELGQYEVPFHTIDPVVDPRILSCFYNTIDILAHARADGETFGVNIAEAMMHGKPVVTHWATPSVPGMGVFQSQTELVDDGKTGFVVENDHIQYADALQKMIDSPSLRDSMGEAGQLKAENEYHVKKCVGKLERIYREIVLS
jgi:glycosyltransferase involved in cell wall biosynthesis